MKRPHVTSLRYRLEAKEWAKFPDPSPVEVHTDLFDLRLDNDIVAVQMKEHHSTGDSAREKVEEYLRRWEILSALEHSGRPLMNFECESVEIVDLEDASSYSRTRPVTTNLPIPPRKRVLTLPTYPATPDSFGLSEEVEAMWENYTAYVERRYPLLPLAYSCYTLLLYAVGAVGTSEAAVAADNLCVSKNVLDALRIRSSRLGTKSSARKLGTQSAFRSPTSEEVRWFEQVLQIL